jgi:hypothetical protein
VHSRDDTLLNDKSYEEQARIESNANRTHFVAFLLAEGVGLGERELVGVGDGVGVT